jgi:hypothetical protein
MRALACSAALVFLATAPVAGANEALLAAAIAGVD